MRETEAAVEAALAALDLYERTLGDKPSREEVAEWDRLNRAVERAKRIDDETE